MKKISAASRDKIIEERKQNEKSVCSYENELEKLNTLISSLEVKISEKDKEYQ